MRAKLNVGHAFANLRRRLEWGRGTSSSESTKAAESPLVRPTTTSFAAPVGTTTAQQGNTHPHMARPRKPSEQASRSDESAQRAMAKHLLFAAMGGIDETKPSSGPGHDLIPPGPDEGPADHPTVAWCARIVARLHHPSGRVATGRGLGEGPVDQAESPPATTPERPSRRAPSHPNPLRGRVALSAVAVVTGLLLAAAPQALAATPVPITSPATEVKPTSATLNGTVNPEGVELKSTAGCLFEYGETEAYGEKVECEETSAQIGEGHEPVAVHADLIGLTRATTYHFRLVTANAIVTAGGSDHSFTAPAVRLSTGEATDLAFNSATLNGEVDPEGEAIEECVFKYNGETVPCEAPDAAEITGPDPVQVHAKATGLKTAGGEYTFALSAKNAHGESSGGSQAFTTTAAHVFSTSFSGEGSNALASPDYVAVDESTGDVYVSDPADYRVEKFTPTGHFIFMIGKEVNKTKAEEAAQPGNPQHVTEAEQDLCTAIQEEAGDTCQPGTPGSSPGAFQATPTGEPFGFNEAAALFLAVDNSPGGAGDLYVGDRGDSLVSKFDSEGHLITGWGAGGQLGGANVHDGPFSKQSGLEGVAVNPQSGELVVSAFLQVMYEFRPDGSPLATVEPSGFLEHYPDGIAVDAAGDVYMNREPNQGSPTIVVAHPRPAPGSFVIYQPSEPLESPSTASGLASDALTRDLYATYPAAGGQVQRFSPSCPEASCATEVFGAGDLDQPTGVAVDAASGDVYVADTADHRVAVFTPVPYLPDAVPASPKPESSTAELLQGRLAPALAGPIASCRFQYAPANQVYTLALAAATGGTFTLSLNDSNLHITPKLPYDVTAQRLQAALEGQALLESGNVAVTGPQGGPYRIELIGFFADFGANPVEPLTVGEHSLTPPAAHIELAATNVPGSWATTATTTSCQQPTPYAGEEEVSALAPALQPGSNYAFRLLATNSQGTETSFAGYFTTLPSAPKVESTATTAVFADTAQLRAQIDPGGGEAAYQTSYHVEYLTAAQFEQNEAAGEEGFAHAARSPDLSAGSAKLPQSFAATLTGLSADTAYHYRLVAENECEPEKQCALTGEARAFTTLPNAIAPNDPCPNSHVRQQTSAAQLLDCRAYELVSAPHTAGYDVESNLIQGQAPFAGYPEAKAPSGEPRLLYGIHDGAVPGLGEPANRGVVPYVATRTAAGWRSEYAGLPSTLDPASPPFGSPLLAADSSLEALAFGGPGLCAPCFGEGLQTGIPVHLSGQEAPAQGMVPASGSTPPPSATPDGYIAAPLSADGQHLIFGSTSQFAPGGNDETGDVSIYDRDLKTGETHTISDNENGEPLACLPTPGQCHSPGDPNGISELAVSTDGSHILLGQKVTEDTDHNVYWHLYMDVNDSNDSIELTPGATEGVLFAGMTEDGSEVFFTSAEHLTHEDTSHTGADLYMWSQEGEEEGHPLTLLSTGEGSAGDTGSCIPLSNANGAHWNSLEATANCSVLAIGGGGGLAAKAGDVYFLSPEKLESAHGAKNRPNLYLAVPGQTTPRFIATLSPEDQLVIDALREAEARRTADFQLTPGGEFAAFPSTLPLAGKGEETAEHAEVYRYDAATEALACASCTLTETPSTASSSLAADGLSLTEDGRLFFNSDDALVATDTDEVSDVYEWEPLGVGGCAETTPAYSAVTESCRALVSAGTSTFPSSLLSADASGADVYFFTRDRLAQEDENGSTMKVYDAREGGGFSYQLSPPDCKASDECHGPASQAPPQIEIGSEAGTPHNYTPEEETVKPVSCKKGYVKKHGACVRKPKPHSHHAKKHRKSKHKRGGKK